MSRVFIKIFLSNPTLEFKGNMSIIIDREMIPIISGKEVKT